MHVSYPLSLLPDPDALQKVTDYLGSMFAVVWGTADVGNFIWTSPIICNKDLKLEFSY